MTGDNDGDGPTWRELGMMVLAMCGTIFLMGSMLGWLWAYGDGAGAFESILLALPVGLMLVFGFLILAIANFSVRTAIAHFTNGGPS